MLAKVEYLNPGGSVKDRIATRMIEAAEASGELQPGGTIVEPTSGNTGVGLAMVAQAKGYKCVFVCPDKVSEDKRNVLKAYGAEVVVCPTAVAPEHPDSYYNVSDRLVSQPGAWKPDQYSNPQQPALALRDHRPGDLGPDRGPDHALRVRRRHRRHDQRHRPLPQGAEPRHPGDRRRPRRLGVLRRHRPSLPRRGRGRGLLAGRYDRDVADRIIEVSDADSFAFTRRLAREEALLVGGSSGMAAYAAKQLALELAGTPEGEDAVIVVLLPDSGRGYLTKVFNDDWLGQYGFPLDGVRAASQTVGEVLRGKDGRLPDLVHTHPSETIAEAVHILQEYGVSQMPVVRAEPPIVAAEVAGSVSERDLLDALFTGTASLPTRSRSTCPRRCRRSARRVGQRRREAARGRRRCARPRGRQAGRGAHPPGPAGVPGPRLTFRIGIGGRVGRDGVGIHRRPA